MGLIKVKYVVIVDDSDNSGYEELCYVRSVKRNSKDFFEMSPLRAKGHHYTSNANAKKCCERLREMGYQSWVENFYHI